MEEKIEIIREMLIDGDSIDKIARITKLSVDEVEKIAKDFTN
jgi:DNA invertase Pin-like site-specific DNA recombinase